LNVPSEKDLRLRPFELLLTQERIAARIAELGARITDDYTNRTPLLLGVLKGCIVFLADLMRVIKLPIELEFISAASYRAGTERGGKLLMSGASAIPLEGRDLLIVEGVVDSGRTVDTLIKEVRKAEPASVEVVTLINKPSSHRCELDIKYVGFSLGNEFVIGYGLDNTQRYRNLPFIGKMVDE
jgi:hypoxanthine phosphoribosyltransferase